VSNIVANILLRQSEPALAAGRRIVQWPMSAACLVESVLP
jgi:hypothetical protein